MQLGVSLMISHPERISPNRTLPLTIPGVAGVFKEKALQRTISSNERVALRHVTAWVKPLVYSLG
jgi:hypothetical protein